MTREEAERLVEVYRWAHPRRAEYDFEASSILGGVWVVESHRRAEPMAEHELPSTPPRTRGEGWPWGSVAGLRWLAGNR